jgi:hypothetical protein
MFCTACRTPFRLSPDEFDNWTHDHKVTYPIPGTGAPHTVDHCPHCTPKPGVDGEPQFRPPVGVQVRECVRRSDALRRTGILSRVEATERAVEAEIDAYERDYFTLFHEWLKARGAPE